MEPGTQRFSFEALLENSHEMIVLIDKDSNAIYISPSVYHQMGWEFAETIGTKTVSYLHPEDAKIQAETLRNCLQNPGVPFKHRVRIRKSDGVYFWAESTFTNFLDRAGVNGIVINFRNIDEEKRAYDQLIYSEDKYRLLSEIISDFAYGLTLEPGKKPEVEFLTPSYYEFIGYTVEEINAMGGVISLVHPEDVDVAKKHTAKLLSGISDTAEYRIRNAKGEYIWLSDHCRSEIDPQTGHVNRIIGICKNITIRKTAEMRLYKVLEENRTMISALNQIPSLVYIKDREHKYIQFNQSLLNFFDKKSEEIYMKSDYELFDAKEAQAHQKADNSVFETGKVITREFEHIDQNGNKRIYYTTKSPLFNDKNEVWAVCGVSTDVTEIHTIQKELEASEARFREMAEHAPGAIILLELHSDTNLRFKYVSASCERLIGYTYEDVKNFNPAELTHPEDMPELGEKLIHMLSNPGSVFTARYRFKHKNGSYRIVESTFNNLIHDPNVQGVYVNFYDVTDRVQSEQQIHTLTEAIEQSSFSIAISDMHGIITYTNRNLSKSIGKSPNEIIGQHIKTIKPNLFDQGFDENQWQYVSSGNIWTSIIHQALETGDIKWESVRISPIMDERKQVLNIVFTCEDISLRKQLENELTLSEDKFSKAFMLSPNLMAITNLKTGKFIDVNESFLKTLGYTRDEIIGSSAEALNLFALPEQRNKAKEILLRDGVLDNFEVLVNAKDGHKHVGLFEGTIFKTAESHFLLTIMNDITLQKEVIDSLKESEYMLAESQRVGQIGSYSANLSKDYWKSSNALEHIFGISIDYPKNIQTWINLIHPEDLETMQTYLLNDVIGNKRNFDKVYRVVRADSNEVRWVHGLGEVKEDAQTGDIIMIGTIQDITQRKMMELEEEKNYEELKRRNQELEQFSYIISHHLRAPLTNILGVSEIIASTNTHDNELSSLNKALSISAMKLDQVVSDLNQILYIRESNRSESVIINLKQLVDSTRNRIDSEMNTKDVQYHLDLQVQEIKGVLGYMQSIVYNLFINSIKYKRDMMDCEIYISSSQQKDAVLISIRDNGSGIDLQRRGNEIFGLYKRFHHHVEGKGMGLFLVKTQVEAMGGSIDVKSELNIGTEFIIRLPIF